MGIVAGYWFTVSHAALHYFPTVCEYFPIPTTIPAGHQSKLYVAVVLGHGQLALVCRHPHGGPSPQLKSLTPVPSCLPRFARDAPSCASPLTGAGAAPCPDRRRASRADLPSCPR